MDVLEQLRNRSTSVLEEAPPCMAQCVARRVEDEGISLGYSPMEGGMLSGVCNGYVMRRGCLEALGGDTGEKVGYKHPENWFVGRGVLDEKNCKKFTVGELATPEKVLVHPPQATGFHCYHMSCTRLNYLTIGITSMVGASNTEPSFAACLKNCSPVPATPQYRIFYKSHREVDETTSKGLNIPLETILQGGWDDTLFTIGVAMDLTRGVVGFLAEGTLIGSVYLGKMTGEYAVMVEAESGAGVKLVNVTPCSYQELTQARHIAGSPFNRRESLDGCRGEASFRFPLGLAYSAGGYLFTGDRDVIRVVDTATGEVSSRHIQQPFSCVTCREPDFLKVLEYYPQLKALTAYDTLNKAWLLVSTQSWEVKKEFHGTSSTGGDIDTFDAASLCTDTSNHDTAYGCYGRSIGGMLQSPESLRNGVAPWAWGVGGSATLNGYWFLSLTSRSIIVTIPPVGDPYLLLGTLDAPGMRGGWGSECRLTHPTSLTIYGDSSSPSKMLLLDTHTATVYIVKLRLFNGQYDAYAVPLTLTTQAGVMVEPEISNPLGLCPYDGPDGTYFLSADTIDDSVWSLGPVGEPVQAATELPECAVWQYLARYLMDPQAHTFVYQPTAAYLQGLSPHSAEFDTICAAISELVTTAAHSKDAHTISSVLGYAPKLIDKVAIESLRSDPTLHPDVKEVLDEFDAL